MAKGVWKGPQRPGVHFPSKNPVIGSGVVLAAGFPFPWWGPEAARGLTTLGGGRCSQGGVFPPQAPGLRAGWRVSCQGVGCGARGAFFAPGGRFSRLAPFSCLDPLFVLKTAIGKNNQSC